jgi:uncharacterized protein (TIGR02271 family)
MDEARPRRRADDTADVERENVVPLAEEELVVERRTRESGRVRISKNLREREELVQDSILREEVEVQRVPIDRVVERAPDVRYEADVLVIPVVEEVAVVQKQLVLKEELHVRKRVREAPHEERVTLRSEEAVVQRVAGDDPPAS